MEYKKYQKINNEKWVQDHNLCLDPFNVEATFKYIQTHHPYGGCVSWDFSDPDPSLEMKEHATNADAVTITCFEVLGNKPDANSQNDSSLKTINKTAVGNIAYIALHHSNVNVRKQWIEIFNQWKELNKKTKICSN